MKRNIILGTILVCVLMMTFGSKNFNTSNEFDLFLENVEALASTGESTGLIGNTSLQESTVTEQHTVSGSGTIKVKLRNTEYHRVIVLNVSETPGSTHSYRIKKKECNYSAKGHCDASQESATIIRF